MNDCHVPSYRQSFCFQNLINIFLDTLIQEMFSYIMKINKFRGDLSDNSAKKEPQVTVGVWSLLRVNCIDLNKAEAPAHTRRRPKHVCERLFTVSPLLQAAGCLSHTFHRISSIVGLTLLLFAKELQKTLLCICTSIISPFHLCFRLWAI